MTSVFTTNLNIEEPGLGDYSGDWNIPINNDLSIIDQAFGSSTIIPFTNANVTLTVAQAAFYMIVCTGTLSGPVELILPAAIGGSRKIFNQTGGGYTLTVLNGSSDPGGGVVCGSGFITPIVLTGGRAYYDDYSASPPGSLLSFAGASAPPGFLLCYGQAVSQTTYAALYGVLGTTWGSNAGGNFTLPDFRGIVLAGADNMGGSAAGRLTGYTVGTSGGAQSIVLTTPQIPSHTHIDSGHTHTITDPGHIHGGIPLGTVGAGGSGTNVIVPSGGNSASATTGITGTNSGTANIQNTGGGGSHPNVQPTAAVNILIRF